MNAVSNKDGINIRTHRGPNSSPLADSENISGATRIYEERGFQVTKRHTIYRKPL